MLAHVKAPRIDVEIKGNGVELIEARLKKEIPGVEIAHGYDMEGTVPIEEIDWYKEMEEKVKSGDVLHVYRDNANLSLSQLSEKTGIAKSNLSEMEHNKRAIGVKIAKKLSKALNCDYKHFL